MLVKSAIFREGAVWQLDSDSAHLHLFLDWVCVVCKTSLDAIEVESRSRPSMRQLLWVKVTAKRGGRVYAEGGPGDFFVKSAGTVRRLVRGGDVDCLFSIVEIPCLPYA